MTVTYTGLDVTKLNNPTNYEIVFVVLLGLHDFHLIMSYNMKNPSCPFHHVVHVFCPQCCMVQLATGCLTCVQKRPTHSTSSFTDKFPFSITPYKSTSYFPPPSLHRISLSTFLTFILHATQLVPWILANHHGVQIALFILGAKGKSCIFFFFFVWFWPYSFF